MKIGIFYYISNLEIFFRQNDLKRFSTLCPKAYFGIFAVHPKMMDIMNEPRLSLFFAIGE